jgi:hypothetical protein
MQPTAQAVGKQLEIAKPPAGRKKPYDTRSTGPTLRICTSASGTILPTTMKNRHYFPALAAFFLACILVAHSQTESAHPIVLHAARLLDVESGHTLKPGEVTGSRRTDRRSRF